MVCKAARGKHRGQGVDLRVSLGGEVLSVLGELLGDPGLIESLRLYLGHEVREIALLRRSLGGAVEEYVIDTVGRLVYTWRDTHWDLPEEEVMAPRRVVLSDGACFLELDLESVSELHQVVTREDWVDRLAWRTGRIGKPGYRSWGFEEERDTWSILSADPGERHRRARPAGTHVQGDSAAQGR
jgi:hypothetical protein